MTPSEHNRPKTTILRCGRCNRKIQVLDEEDAISDILGHGWSNWKTAQEYRCYDCADIHDRYETYYAGRVKRGYPNRVYMMLPDPETGKDIECFTEVDQ